MTRGEQRRSNDAATRRLWTLGSEEELPTMAMDGDAGRVDKRTLVLSLLALLLLWCCVEVRVLLHLT